MFTFVSITQAQSDAYSIEVAVADRTIGEQRAGYRVAMRRVLLNNSGDKTLLNRTDVRNGLREAEKYVSSFSYRSPEPGSVISRDTPLTDTVRRTGQATQLMLVRFDQVGINELIYASRKQDAEPADDEESVDPLQNVRSALLWLIVEDGAQQMLIGGTKGQNVMQRAREIAGAGGMSLSFPAADSTDELALTADDIQAAALDRLGAATSRYAQQVVLAAYLARTRTGGWEGQWIKAAGEQQLSSRSTSRSLDEALQQGLAWLNPAVDATGSDERYQSGAGANASASEALVWVSPLRSTGGYAEVLRLFSELDQVTTVYPKEVLDGGMIFAVQPRTAVNAINAAAAARAWIQRSALPTTAAQSQLASGVVLSLEYLR